MLVSEVKLKFSFETVKFKVVGKMSVKMWLPWQHHHLLAYEKSLNVQSRRENPLPPSPPPLHAGKGEFWTFLLQTPRFLTLGLLLQMMTIK